jgi:dihydropteroate synthase
MQQNPTYGNVCEEVYDFFVKTIKQCNDHDVYDVIVDVGFGFGKTLSHNYELLYNLSIFKNLHKPILVGISRKSMVCKPLHVISENALNGSTALHMLALQNGANILRVHDVKEAMECIKLFENYIQHAV